MLSARVLVELGRTQEALDMLTDFVDDDPAGEARLLALEAAEKDFFSSITKIDGPDGKKRYIFHGVLNGWVSLTQSRWPLSQEIHEDIILTTFALQTTSTAIAGPANFGALGLGAKA